MAAQSALAGYGLQIPAGDLVSNADEAVSCAERIGYPVVIKAVSDTIVHKTEQGAVQLFLQSAEDVRDAVSRMAHLSDAFLVEQMLTETVGELLIPMVVWYFTHTKKRPKYIKIIR